jgi:DNA-binding transcriptional ArsR family regulator
MTNHDALALRFRALADPTRAAIVARLARGAAPVSELAAPHGMTLPTILRHLEVLEQGGLVLTRKQGRQRLCTLNRAAMAEARDWLADRVTEWEDRLNRLDALALAIEAQEKTDDKNHT